MEGARFDYCSCCKQSRHVLPEKQLPYRKLLAESTLGGLSAKALKSSNLLVLGRARRRVRKATLCKFLLRFGLLLLVNPNNNPGI